MSERKAMTSPAQGSERGFSLIETMIAIGLLAVGVMGLAVLMPTATQNDFRSRLDTTATFIATRHLEQMLAQPYVITTFTGAADGLLNTAANLSLTCNPNPTAPPAADCSAGATLSGSLIDFTQAYAVVPNGYKRLYQIAASADPDAPTVNNGTYEVRWNVAETTSGVRTILVAVRPTGDNPGAIAVPANIRAIRMR